MIGMVTVNINVEESQLFGGGTVEREGRRYESARHMLCNSRAIRIGSVV